MVRGTRHVTDIMPVLVLLSVVGVGLQQCMIQNGIVVFNVPLDTLLIILETILWVR